MQIAHVLQDEKPWRGGPPMITSAPSVPYAGASLAAEMRADHDLVLVADESFMASFRKLAQHVPLFGDFLVGWLDRYKQRVRPSTLKRRREALRALVALEEAQSDPSAFAVHVRAVLNDALPGAHRSA